MKLLTFLSIFFLVTACYKPEVPHNKNYEKFLGVWRSTNLENQIEFTFERKYVRYKGTIDRGDSFKISRFDDDQPNYKSLRIYSRGEQIISIDYKDVLDTIICNSIMEFQFDNNAHWVRTKLVRI